MKPKIIIHNEITFDGCITGFEANFGAYYGLMSRFKPQGILVGSKTLEAAPDVISPEKEEDKAVHEVLNDDSRPFWIIPDSSGRLMGKLHYYRKLEYVKDVVILISSATPQEYISYLEERKILNIAVGNNKVDLRIAMEKLASELSIERIVTDCGSELASVLVKNNLADEISLLLSPQLVGKNTIQLFDRLEMKKPVNFLLKENKILDSNYCWLLYDIIN